MRYEIIRLPQSAIELRVTIPRDDMQRSVEQALASIIAKEALEPIERPEITVTKLAPDNDTEFTARFQVLPAVRLPRNWRDVIRETKKERRKETVEDAEVNTALSWLQDSRATQNPVARPCQTGDVVTATIRASSGGVPIPNGTLAHHSFILGKGTLMPEVEAEIAGLSKGDQKNFHVIVPETYWQEALRGKSVQFHVEIEDVQERRVPLLDDEFARRVSRFETLQDLAASIRKGLLAEKQEKENERMRILMLERLGEKITIEVPQALLSQELDRMLEELKSSAEHLGMTWEKYLESLHRTEASLREELKDGALKRAKFALVLRQIATEIHIEPSNEDVEAEMNKYLLRYSSPEEADRNIDVAELARYTRNVLRNEKTFQYLETIS